MTKWLLLLVLAAGAIVFASWRAHCTLTPSLSETRNPVSVAATVQEIHGIGYVEPVSEVRKLMFRTGGVIKRCYYNVGDRVKKDSVIVELEDATQRAAVEVARQNLELARADADHVNVGTNPYRLKVIEHTLDRLKEKLRFCQADVERYKALRPVGGVGKQQYEAAETLHLQTEIEIKEQEAELLHLRNTVTPEHKAMLQAKVRAAQAQLELAQEYLQETRLPAPFTGTILKVLKREGEGVRQLEPDPVILFGDQSRLRVRAEIDERFVQQVAVGQLARVYGRNLVGKTCKGQVAYLEHLMGDKTVFTQTSSERKDLQVLQVLIDMEPGFRSPSGLRVDVTILGSPSPPTPEEGGSNP